MLYRLLIVVCTTVLIAAAVLFYFHSETQLQPPASATIITREQASQRNPDAIENGIHLGTGLIVADGYREVINNCTQCHSASLVTQNRMDAKGWEATIRWMQETQNLWDLGKNKALIIDYLVTNYPVENKGRRVPLKDIEWYRLNQ